MITSINQLLLTSCCVKLNEGPNLSDTSDGTESCDAVWTRRIVGRSSIRSSTLVCPARGIRHPTSMRCYDGTDTSSQAAGPEDPCLRTLRGDRLRVCYRTEEEYQSGQSWRHAWSSATKVKTYQTTVRGNQYASSLGNMSSVRRRFRTPIGRESTKAVVRSTGRYKLVPSRLLFFSLSRRRVLCP